VGKFIRLEGPKLFSEK